MPLLICGIISVALLVATVVVAVLLRKDLRKSVRALSVGFFAAIFVALAPRHIGDNGYSFGVNLFDTICVMITQSSLTDALEAIGAYDYVIADVYKVYLICLYVLGPISIASATLSFVKGFGRVVYAIKSVFADSYVFSSVNKRSLSVCKSIRQAHPKAVFLFALDGQDIDSDDEMSSQIEDVGGIVVKCSVKDVKHNLRHKRHYCLLDKDGASNIEYGLALNDKYKDSKQAKERVELLIYSTDEMSQIVFYNTSHNVTIRLFREEEIIANDLIFNYPLYGGVVDGKLNVLLVGGGKIGYEILKKVIWSGYLGDKVATQITVVDLNAKSIESRLKKDCPALFSECNLTLKFTDADINSDTFPAAIDKINAPTYIVVALGNEKINAETCIYLRRHFGLTEAGFPRIHMTTDTEDYADKLKLLNVCDWSVQEDRTFSQRGEYSENFQIKGFGSYESAYRRIYTSESALGLLALACHQIKMGISSRSGKSLLRRENETIEQYVNSLSYSYNQIFFSKYNADQMALSISYILYMLGYPTKCRDHLEQVRQCLDLQSIYDIPYALYIDPNYNFAGELQAQIDDISAVVTERYNRFMFTLGWTKLPIDEIKNKSTRDQLRLRYARIGKYDVDALEKLINEGAAIQKHYRKNDKDELLSIPSMMEIYNEISAQYHRK